MDTITYEVIRNSLYAIAREMKIAMMRTAASPIMHMGADASAAVFDADMQLVAQGNDIPTMLGSAVISTKVSVDAIGKENLRPGDVIISNDAYLGGGNHQPDRFGHMLAPRTPRSSIIRVHRGKMGDGFRKVKIKSQMFKGRVVVRPFDAVAVARLF